MSPTGPKPAKERSNEARHAVSRDTIAPHVTDHRPAAGAHAAIHLINEDATPGAGALPNHAHDGKEVDGGAG